MHDAIIMSSKLNGSKHLDPNRLTFSIFTADDIRNLSVLKISTPLSFNILGHPLKGGLYDTALGPLNNNSDPCATCGQGVVKCPGHFGHIELPLPVINPLFHKTLWTILKLSCLNCHTLQIPRHTKVLLTASLRLIQEGFANEVEGLEQEVGSAVANMNQIHDAEIEFIKDIIDSYCETARNRRRFERISTCTETDSSLNSKSLNTEWHNHVETVLKQHTSSKLCINCRNSIPKITILKNKIMTTKAPNVEHDPGERIIHKLENVFIMPDESKEHLRAIWQNESEILRSIIPCLSRTDLEYPTDLFFFEIIPVLPPIVRPVNILNDQTIEHSQTQVYKSIIQDCLVLKNIIQTIRDGDTSQLPEEGKLVLDHVKGSSPIEKLHNGWQALQANVDHLMDREMSKTSESANCQGLKQVIEKKEGIIRMHMMGKRVNFAARSVITPDPNLNIDEIGVPEAFALKLTYPVPVTPWNVAELRKLIMNGPDVHPGAVLIEEEDGFVRRLSNQKWHLEATAKRLLTAGNKKYSNGIKIVHRHLQNGDWLLLNRQPTLHKPSIMAHRARILRGEKTLRLHYANCKAYNADFDGDEMNAHLPQNEVARSEAAFIANVSNQYLVPKDGTPLGGLIQDHVISGVRLTLRGNFFSREDYMQLVYSAISDHVGQLTLLPPTILKPVKLWSGKQVVSTVIINVTKRGRARINLEASAKISAKEWQVEKARKWKCGVEFEDPKNMSEAQVVIRGGELLSGVLDKTHYGATPYGLIHCLFELYGGSCSTRLLSAFGKLFQTYLQVSGFTLGIQDILVVRKSDEKRRKIIKRCRKVGEEVQRSILQVVDEDTPRETLRSKMEESYANDPKFRAQVDRKYKSVLDIFTNDVNKSCLPAGLLKKFPANNLQLMVQSGAKGSTVNTMQISCLLGQIELEGKRPPLMMSGKSLPSFPPYDPSPRSGGFIDGRFMTGIQPQEFFFHCMAGREGLIDTAVKTSRSGYLQRCLIKHLEGLTVNYDGTVRDSDGSLIQMSYGEDGLDVCNSRFLRKEQMEFLVENRRAIVDQDLVDSLKDETTERARNIYGKLKKWRAKYGNELAKRRVSEFAKFSALNWNPASSKNQSIQEDSGRSRSALSLMKKWAKADEKVKKALAKQCKPCPEPVTAKYRQDLHFGILTERMEALIEDYLRKKPRNPTGRIETEEMRDLMGCKVTKCLCPPGEPVGLLAAQSVGEPSTQMTLNTFHFAGRGDMNVTLGIPRLREILMMASKNIKTPSMEIPFKKDVANLDKRSKKLQLKLTRCVLSDILASIRIDRKLETDGHRRLDITLTINCLPYKYYKNEFSVKPKQVIDKIEGSFFKELFKEMKKIGKSTGSLLRVEEEKKKSQVDDRDLDNIDDDDESDMREASRKQSSRFDLGELHESSDEEEMAEDADATLSRSLSRHRENQEYEDPEDEEIQDALVEPDQDDTEVSPENDLQDDDDADDPSLPQQAIDDQKRTDILNTYNYALDYDYDADKFLWCKLKFWLPLKMSKLDLPTILRTVAKRVVLWETPAIRRAFTFQNNDGETILKTDGLNIVEMFKYAEILDLRKLYSNDIYGVSQTYGIEAANRVILKEVKDVFKMYGITVDTRHLSLIADYMTFDGTFQPLSRKGMEDAASPLQQMSFESSLNFLKNATLQSKQDDLTSPSSRLMTGQPCKTGTGAFSVYLKTHTYPISM